MSNVNPNGYYPYARLEICSNVLIGGGHLISLGTEVPLVIGAGTIPQVWLRVPIDAEGKNYREIVAASVAAHPAATVLLEGNRVKVSIANKQVLSVIQTSGNSAVVDQLDLRPIGFEVHGDKNSLIAGNANLSKNTMEGTFSLIGFSA